MVPKDVFEKSYQVAEDFKDRLIIEFNELKERFNKLDAFLDGKHYDKIVEKCGTVQTDINAFSISCNETLLRYFKNSY